MKELSLNFVIGITSGLLTAVIVVLFRAFWVGVLIPWFEERVYKDAKIEGDWFGRTPGNEFKFTLERAGHKITGRIHSLSGNDTGKEWVISGSFRNLILSAVYEPTDRQRLDRGSMTLMLRNDGFALAGRLAYYLDLSHTIAECPLHLDRDRNAQGSKNGLEQRAGSTFANPAKARTQKAEQDGTGQPATRPESKSEDGDKPQPEAEGRSR